MDKRTPSDPELLRAVYRSLDWDKLVRDFPGVNLRDVKALFRRLAMLLPAAEAAVDTGGDLVEEVIIHADGGSRGTPGPAGYGVVLHDCQGRVLAERGVFIGRATNNEAEYQGLIAGLKMARELGAASVSVRADSQLIVRQVNGEYRVRCAHLRPLYEEAHSLLESFATWRIEHIRREQNCRADELANQAMDEAAAKALGR